MTSSPTRRFLWRWLPLLMWMAIIFVLSHQPTTNIPGFGLWDSLVKKGGHLLAYAVLAVLAQRALEHKRWAFVLTAVYAISDEYHQTFIPGRNGQLADVIIDCLGALVGLTLFDRWPRRWPLIRWGQKVPVGKRLSRDV